MTSISKWNSVSSESSKLTIRQMYEHKYSVLDVAEKELKGTRYLHLILLLCSVLVWITPQPGNTSIPILGWDVGNGCLLDFWTFVSKSYERSSQRSSLQPCFS